MMSMVPDLCGSCPSPRTAISPALAGWPRWSISTGLKSSSSSITQAGKTVTALTGGQPVVSASAIPCKYLQQETRALTTEEVQQLITQFVAGAARVQKAGCDGVELHAAHGYLLQQFLSPYTNKREDQYGGSFENRLRMISEIIAGIRETCGPDFPIGVRLSVEEFLDKTGVSEDYIHIQDGVKIAMAFGVHGH